MSILVITILILINGFAQILLKIGATTSRRTIPFTNMSVHTAGGYFLFFISTILSVYLMQRINFKSFTLVIALNYVVAFILSVLILRENCSKQKVISTIFIVVGVIIFNL